mmetsp:Transcript_5848/g.10934  ORF Transcript_5848/g.10934 Transcript_5848/m.10934 type:complete len:516 (+) Transcript_5848:141-1688(+)
MSSLENLQAMGFAAESASAALAMNSQNFDNALSMLLSQASHAQAFESEPPPSKVPSAKSAAAAVVVDPELDSLAGALASNRDALNAVLGVVDKLLAGGGVAQTALVLHLGSKSKLSCLAAGGAGVRFLHALGYYERSGFYVVATPPTAARLEQARGALERAMSDEAYLLADALETSASAAQSHASSTRAAMRKRAPRVEPEEGSGLMGTRLVIHVHAQHVPGQGGGELQVLERRFAPDDLLCDVVHWLGCSPSKALEGSHSFELLENAAEAPFWWCHGWQLLDVTMRPPRPLGVEHATKTLQALELWPSAHLKLTLVPLGRKTDLPSSRTPSAKLQAASSSSSSASSTEEALGGGRYLAGRPKPSDIMASVTSEARFGDGGDLAGKSSGEQTAAVEKSGSREHFRVNGRGTSSSSSGVSAAAAAAEARMAKQRGKQTSTAAASTPAAAATLSTAATMAQSPGGSTPAPAVAGVEKDKGGGAVLNLVSMGFTEQAARAALAKTGGNVERAIETLLG